MPALNRCRSCDGLIPRGRARCPHCDTVRRTKAAVAVAIGIGSSLVGCGGGPQADVGPLGSCIEAPDSGPEHDAGITPVAAYGIVVLPDGGER